MNFPFFPMIFPWFIGHFGWVFPWGMKSAEKIVGMGEKKPFEHR